MGSFCAPYQELAGLMKGHKPIGRVEEGGHKG